MKNSTVVSTIALVVGAFLFVGGWWPSPGPMLRVTADMPSSAAIGSAAKLAVSFERWKRAKARSAHPDRLNVPLSYWRARSSEYTPAHGTASFDLASGAFEVVVRGLNNAPAHGVWLVDGGTSPAAARQLYLGSLAGKDAAARLLTTVTADDVRGFELDRIVVAAVDSGPLGHAKLVGSPSLFQRLFHSEREQQLKESRTALTLLVPQPAYAQSGAGPDLDSLVAEGERLFFEESFSGNGRTCGTCHRADNNFTIDPAYIATLPADDPLFVAETNPELAGLENPDLMREFGLILTNIDGFEDPTNKIAMRSVSHILGMAASIQSDAEGAPLDRTGWSGDGAPGAGRLRDFAAGAVKQHMTRSLARIENMDFRLPNEAELDALEAFMLSLGRQTDFDLTTLELADRIAERGRQQFLVTDSLNGTVNAAKCQICHQNAGAFTQNDADRVFNGNFNTAVEDRAHPAVLAGHTLPRDGGAGTELDEATGGFGTGEFNAQSLWEVADTGPFFHNHLALTLEDAVSHYTSPEFKASPDGFLLRSRDSAGADIEAETDDLAAFLRALNAMENMRSSTEYLNRAQVAETDALAVKVLELANADIEDAMQVMLASELHDEDAVPLLGDAMTEVDAAIATTDAVLRGEAIDAALDLLVDARAILVISEPLPIDPPAAAPAPLATPDMNADGVINFGDLAMLRSMFLTSDSRGDFNGDGLVNFGDLAIMKSRFFEEVDPPVDPPMGDDTAPPVINILTPDPVNVLTGVVGVSASASDDLGVARVSFEAAGVSIGEVTEAPYSTQWDSRGASDGMHLIVATATDFAGKETSATVEVTVNHPPCTSPYGCFVGSPPPPPPPRVPPPADQDSLPEFKGIVRNKSMSLSLVTIEDVDAAGVPNGTLRTFVVHSDTEFTGDIAQNLLHVVAGHRAEGKFVFTGISKEIVRIEVSAGGN